MNNYKAKNTVFEGMKFHIDNNPIELHKLFIGFKELEVEIFNGAYHVKYHGTSIANIDRPHGENISLLTLTPNFFIHRKVAVFKTYNKLLKTFTSGKFIKFIANKWTLCEETEEEVGTIL